MTTPLPTTLPTPVPTTSADIFAFEQNKRLGRGVNLGNALEAPDEGEWGLTLQAEYFKLIKEAGFDSVRVPIRWSAHAETASPYTIDPVFFDRIDWVVDQALKHDLAVILNMHHYEAINEEPRPNHDRFLAMWEQIAKRYKDAPDSVYFEILNEPTGTLGVLSWNDFAAEAIKAIRKTNPDRTIILGPRNWNSPDYLTELVLPEDDRNLIVTIHFYEPFHFTHQGAEWAGGSEAWLGTLWEGNPVEKGTIETSFKRAANWGVKNRRPIYLGEFGAYSKADMDSRVRWTDFVARTAETQGFSWAYWEFGSGFGIYDPELKVWRLPLLKALIP